MKLKAIILALFMAAVFTTGCKFYLPEVVPRFTTPEEVMEFVYENVEYANDSMDEWQTPKETMELGTGDCEDYAILMISILEEMDIESFMVVIKRNDVHNYHALVEVDGLYYEPTGNFTVDTIVDGWEIEMILTYEDLIYIIRNGIRSILNIK